MCGVGQRVPEKRKNAPTAVGASRRRFFFVQIMLCERGSDKAYANQNADHCSRKTSGNVLKRIFGE